MANLNKVFLMGNLTRDPELRYIPSGTAVATFTVASNRSYTSAAGEKKEEACFVRVVSWARQAELAAEYLTKGSPIFVEGRLQSRSWETPDGQKRSTIEVVAQNIQFLGRGKGAVSRPGETGAQAPAPEEPPAGPEGSEVPAETEEQTGEVPF
ncbi:MAG: single-stranded DNA-binding protein [Candidatus Omnitrophota bacterium]|nr:single-stranded DNA-binding protein [Candidatus Omnitrophota bacterium]